MTQGPTLDDLAADPAKAMSLPVEVARALLPKVASLHEVLLVSALAPHAAAPRANPGDRFIDADEVGDMIGKSKSWVEKNTAVLPKRKRVGGEGKWSEREIQQWMRYREPWD